MDGAYSSIPQKGVLNMKTSTIFSSLKEKFSWVLLLTLFVAAIGFSTSVHAGLPPITTTILVDSDLKPGSNPNCVNSTKKKGRTPVGIYGSAEFDVQDVNVATLSFGGAAPIKCKVSHLLSEVSTGVFEFDGFIDLICHYSTPAVSWPSEGSDCAAVLLTGENLDGTPIESADLACLAGEETCEEGDPVPLPEPQEPCPCWAEADLMSVTQANQFVGASCDALSPLFPNVALIQNIPGSTPGVEGGFQGVLSDESCATRDFTANSMLTTAEEAAACIAQIAARCDAIGSPITNG